ncbi:MAG: hypothetical protein JXB50_14690 [Spirochaetes bacterium]|nr:hypothetical protein [Spirochaetota bacterium]
MKIKIFLFLLISLFFLNKLIYPVQSNNHYYDSYDNPLDKFEFVYDELKKYFKEKMPDKFIVKYIKTETGIFSSNYSYFNPRNGSILINELHKSDLIQTIAHESCNLCMAYITSNLSVNENYRFFDEGFASIFEKIILNKHEKIVFDELENYKKNSLSIAADQNNKDNVNFKKVQKWSEYFGKTSEKTNDYAYQVGSSFVFYIFDSYGIDSFFQFLIDIAKTQNMDKSFKNIFKKNKSEIEKEWQDYLKKVKLY